MNIVRSIAKREKGSKFIQDYDIALMRLKCYNEDVYRGIAPNVSFPDFNPQPPIYACRFSSTPGYENFIALGNEDGQIALQDTSIKHEPNTALEGIQAHKDAIFDIAWMPQEMKLVTETGNHSACLWDVSSTDIKKVQLFHGHTRSIKSVVFRHQDKAVFATGARDGAIMIWDIRASYSQRSKPDNTISNAHVTNIAIRTRSRRPPSSIRHSQAQSITGLIFQDDYTLISCSTGDGLIKVWDLRKNYTAYKKDPVAKHVMHYGGKTNNNGFTSLLACPAGITLYASCMDNSIYAYNISSYNTKPFTEYYGHENSSFYVKACLSPDGRYLASGSSDEMAYIWNTKKPGLPLAKLFGHKEEVTCVTWCSIGEPKIVTCSDDSCHRIWRIGKEHISDDEKFNIHGYAEPILPLTINQMKISSLETTPTVTKLQMNKEYSSESETTPVNTPNPNSFKDNDKIESTKRSYARMLNGYGSEENCKSILSPIHENLEVPPKRSNIENKGARRLFSPDNKIKTFSNKKNETLNNDYESDDSGPSTSHKLDKSFPFSPTSNLPNFVIDGTAPHLLEMSPQKSKENIDWLTKIRKERYSQRMSKSTEKYSSPKNHAISIHRSSRSKSTEPRKPSKSPANLLLQFFKPAIKDCINDVHLESTNVMTPSSTSEAN